MQVQAPTASMLGFDCVHARAGAVAMGCCGGQQQEKQ